ncbi:MAG: SMC-Scp complex subunit ScpB [Planctomycetota bacterium]
MIARRTRIDSRVTGRADSATANGPANSGAADEIAAAESVRAQVDTEQVNTETAAADDAHELSASDDSAPTDTVSSNTVSSNTVSSTDPNGARRAPRRRRAAVIDFEAEPVERLAGEGLRAALESMLFASSTILSLPQLVALVPEAEPSAVSAMLDTLLEESNRPGAGYRLVLEAGGYRFLTTPECAPFVARLRGEARRVRLSKAAFETLALVAYRQPIRKSDIDAIRGVQSSAIMKSLLDWQLIEIIGRDEQSLGKPLLYTTTSFFLEQFGLAGVSELPDQRQFLEQYGISTVDVDALVKDQ